MKHKGILVLAIALLLVFAGCQKKEEPVETAQTEESVQQTEPAVPVETYNAEESETVQEPETAYNEEPVKETTQYVDEGPEIYCVQLVSLPDMSRVKLQQDIMAKEGVKTVISQFQNGDTVYYRLRLDGKYTKGRAEKLGNEMKEKFWSITDYWVISE